jgi:hypothetical protein
VHHSHGRRHDIYPGEGERGRIGCQRKFGERELWRGRQHGNRIRRRLSG